MPKGAPSDRAWQFMPFSSLRGYEEYLREEEDETVRLTSEIRIPEPGEPTDECEAADEDEALDGCDAPDKDEATDICDMTDGCETTDF